jgi:hypothetical protein
MCSWQITATTAKRLSNGRSHSSCMSTAYQSREVLSHQSCRVSDSNHTTQPDIVKTIRESDCRLEAK